MSWTVVLAGLAASTFLLLLNEVIRRGTKVSRWRRSVVADLEVLTHLNESGMGDSAAAGELRKYLDGEVRRMVDHRSAPTPTAPDATEHDEDAALRGQLADAEEAVGSSVSIMAIALGVMIPLVFALVGAPDGVIPTWAQVTLWAVMFVTLILEGYMLMMYVSLRRFIRSARRRLRAGPPGAGG